MVNSVCFLSLSSYGYFTNDSEIAGGGAQRQLYLVSTELADELDVHMIVGDFGQPQTEVREGVTLHRAYHPERESGARSQIRKLAKLGNAMRRADTDIYVHRGGAKKAAITYALTRLLGKRWVYNLASDNNIWVHPNRLSPPMRHLFDHALKNSHAIIAQTPFQQEELREEHGVDSTVVPNGYPRAETYKQFSDREFFLWVGRINQSNKRPHLFLDIAEALPESQFVLIGLSDGEPEYETRIKQRAADLDNVRFTGPVDPDEIHTYYRDAIALVNTSNVEGFPNTFLEAWRYGTPVVSLSVDPNRFIDIEHGELLYADGNEQALIDTACQLSDVEIRQSIGSESQEAFEATYEIGPVAKKYAEAILE